MATTGAFEDISAEVKNLYTQGALEEMVRTEAKFRNDLKKTPLKGSEGILKFPLRTAGMWNVGIIADNAAFPSAKDPVTLQGTITPELFVAIIQIGLKTKVALKSGKSTFAAGGVLSDRIDTAIPELGSYMNKVYAASNRGRLAIVESDGTSNFVCAKPLGVELLAENMVLEAYDQLAISGASVVDSFSAHQITAIDYDTRTVTYIKFSTQAADDRAVAAGSHIFISGTFARTPVSMPDIVDDSTTNIFGLSRSTYPKLKATVMGNGGQKRNISEQILLDACDRPRRRVGKKITKVLANSGQGRKLAQVIAADRRYPGSTSGSPQYVIGIAEGTFHIVAPGVNAVMECDYDVRPTSVYCLAWDTFARYSSMELGWIEDEELLRMIPTDGGFKSGFQAFAGAVENIFCTMPLANVRIDDLYDPICDTE